MAGFCSDCGQALPADARFCEGCGATASAPAGADAAAASPGYAPGPVSAGLPAWVRAVPPEILAVTGLLLAVGLLVLVPALVFLPDAIQLFSFGGTLATLFGVLFLAFALELAAFGAILLYLARLVYLGDRVGRGLTLVVAGSTVVAYFLGLVAGDAAYGDGGPAGGVTGILALLGALGVIAILFFAPRARAHFDRHDNRPVSVATASTMIAWIAAVGIIDGAILLGFATLKLSFVVYGALFLIASFGLLGLKHQLRAGSPGARWGATAFALTYLVVSVLVFHGTFDYVQLAIGLAIIGLLWLPPEVEAHFGSRLALEKFLQPQATQPGWQTAGAPAPAGPAGYAYAQPQPAAEAPPPASASPSPPSLAACPHCASGVGPADRFCQQCGGEIAAPRPDQTTLS
jgi:hypothetical protein